MNPLVSVVVPVYNGERYLQATLESVMNQDYRPLEILVVDDGSTDRSADIARSFPDVRYFQQANKGPGAARNAGIAAAKGEIIALLDQDDLWKPHKLSVQAGYLIEHPETQYTIARIHMFLEPGVEMPVWVRKESLEKNPVDYGPGSLVARRSAFKVVGRFSEEFQISSDVDWFFTAKDKKVPMAVIDEVLMDKRVHAGNQSARVKPMHSEILSVIRKSVQRSRQEADISVIITAYNTERYIAEAIQSVLDQTLQPKEILVIDDGSTDATRAVVERFAPRVSCYSQANSGAGGARNAGMEKTSGAWVAFLDGDDIWRKDKLAQQLAAAQEAPGYDMAFCHMQNFHSPELDAAAIAKAQAPMDPAPAYMPSAFFVKRGSFLKVGFFGTQWKVGEFIDWYARSKEKGLTSRVVPEVLVRRRLHATNLGVRERPSQADFLDILRKKLARGKNDPS